MRKTLLFVCVVLISVLMSVVGCDNGGDTPTPTDIPTANETSMSTSTPTQTIANDASSPEDTVRGFFAAIQDMNPEKMASFCTEDYAEEFGLEDSEEPPEGMAFKFSNISTEVVEQGEHDAKVNVSYDYQINIEGEVSGNTSATFLLTKVDDSWLIDGDSSDSNESEVPEEAYNTELKNVRLAVAVLMADAGVSQLDADYFEVDTYEEVHNVTAGGGAYSIDDYLDISPEESLRQAYDIAKDGTVTVH
ncbi:MAG: hypothetical protein HQ553_05420 [Chloroflexi bacterium]|nr:hypothetical protein [Chloroflexota bacterium]